jgi:hypothetical protein
LAGEAKQAKQHHTRLALMLIMLCDVKSQACCIIRKLPHINGNWYILKAIKGELNFSDEIFHHYKE